MRRIIAYLVLLIAISSLTLTLTPPVHGQTDNVKVVNYSYHFDPNGILVVAGEIQNNGPDILSQVILSGTAETSYGAEMISGDIAWASNILPGQKAPFFMQIRSNLTSNGAWVGGLGNINVKAIQASTTTEYLYQGVTITKFQSSQGSSGEYIVSGTLNNTGTQSASNVAVVATFYDSNGIPISVGFSSKIANMDPNGVNTFTLTALDANQTIVGTSTISSYTLMVQLDAPKLTGTAPTPIVYNSSGASSPDPSNTANNNLSPIYIIVFVVAIAAIVAVMLLLTRHKPVEIATNKPSKSKKRKRR
jgi:hypothetical protein